MKKPKISATQFMTENYNRGEFWCINHAVKLGLANSPKQAQLIWRRVTGKLSRNGLKVASKLVNQEQPNLFEVPSIQDILIAHARKDKLDDILDMMVNLLKSPGYANIYSQAGCIKWASSKIKENRIAKKLLSAYKRNPSIMTKAVTEVEDFESSLD